MILGILDGLPGNNTYVGRLLQNYQDMEDAHNGDTAAFNDAKARWYDNGRQIAVQMNKMNPRFWPLAETTMMWTDHLDATLEEATDNLTGNCAGEVAAYDRVHDMALEMTDLISAGVTKQFPQKFTGQ